MRGEQPANTPMPRLTKGSPPLARGTVFLRPHRYGRAGITPACAGNSCRQKSVKRFCQDHPRLRGEQLNLLRCSASAAGSPPLARGTDKLFVGIDMNTGITPACAGNRHLLLRHDTIRQDHPRLRGEQVSKLGYPYRAVGSPPLARGTGLPHSAWECLTGITPACAGNRLKKDLLCLIFYTTVFHFSISFS